MFLQEVLVLDEADRLLELGFEIRLFDLLFLYLVGNNVLMFMTRGTFQRIYSIAVEYLTEEFNMF